MSEVSSDPPTHLEPPSKTIELEDSGAPESASSDEDHFSDASEGNPRGKSSPKPGLTSPVPRTQVERVDTSLQHGELLGTSAYENREQDAVPDEITVVPEESHSRITSPAGSPKRPLTPGGSPIPRTVVEKVDPESPAYGEIPGTEAYEKRQADAVPDIVKTTNSEGSQSPPPSADIDTEDQPVPETKISQVETNFPEEELHERPRAHQRSTSDALPDTVETVPDVSISENPPVGQELSSQDIVADEESAFGEDAGDDFDEFVEEQEGMGDDDFGDFDDGFQEPEVADVPTETIQQPQTLPNVPPLTDFDVFKSTSELLDSLQGTLDNLLPASQNLNSLPPVEPIPNSAAIFSTERSLSLWSQLVAPPPLQPQNWVKSRIRRLFLVSLGVPVDLDEILPASKQKKLILPSMDFDQSGAITPSQNQPHKEGETPQNDNISTSGQNPPTRQKTTRRGAVPPPELDLLGVRRLCATTDAAISGLTDEELKKHVQELDRVTLRASTVLEYWLKRRDGLVGEKEAFEGVIENLVSHVRRARK